MCGLTQGLGTLNEAHQHAVNNVTRVSLTVGWLNVLGEQTIELIGEHLALTLTQSSGPAGVDTAAAQLVQEVANGQPLANILARIQLTAGIQRHPALLDRGSGERDVRCYHEVSSDHQLHNAFVSGVESRRDLHEMKVLRHRQPNRLVGNQCHGHPGPFRRAEQDFPDHHRAGISVHPDLHERVLDSVLPWRLAVHATDPQFLPHYSHLLQVAKDIPRHSLGKIDEAVVVADVDVPDVTPLEARLVGDRADDVAGLHAVGVAHFQTEGLEHNIAVVVALATPGLPTTSVT